MKKSISIFLLGTVLFQCCVVYQKTPVSLSDAANKGKVKVVTTNNKKLKFPNIEFENGIYKGTKIVRRKNDQGAYENFDKSKQLFQDSIYAIYLKKVVAKAWIKVKNEQKYAKGILYQANDSSIILVNTGNRKDFNTGHIEFPISDLVEIKLRIKSKVALGAGVGAASGIIIALILIAIEPFALVLSPLIIITTATGAIIGAKKITYRIDGSVEKYSAIKGDLNKYSFSR